MKQFALFGESPSEAEIKNKSYASKNYGRAPCRLNPEKTRKEEHSKSVMSKLDRFPPKFTRMALVGEGVDIFSLPRKCNFPQFPIRSRGKFSFRYIVRLSPNALKIAHYCFLKHNKLRQDSKFSTNFSSRFPKIPHKSNILWKNNQNRLKIDENF